MNGTRTFRFLCLLVLGALVGAASAQFSDTIIRKDRPPLQNVQVVADTYEFVAYKLSGSAEAKSPAHEVVNVTYGDEPFAYVQARGFFRQGAYEIALKKFKEAEKAKARDWIKVYVSFGTAECYRLLERYKEAIDLYKSILKTHPKSRLVPFALDGLAKALMARGQSNDCAEAWRTYQKLDEARFGDMWRLRARFGKGLVKEVEGTAALKANQEAKADRALNQALKQFDDLIKFLDEKDDLVHEEEVILANAKTHKGKTLQALRRYDEAMAWFDKIIQESGGTKVGAAEAYNARGDCLFAMARSREDYRRALWDYLRVAIVYITHPEQHRYALRKVTECYIKLEDTTKASEYRELAKLYYPDSVSEMPEIKPPAAKARHVVVKKETPVYVRNAVIAQAKPGNVFNLQGEERGWVKVTLASGEQGWLRAHSVEIRTGKVDPSALQRKAATTPGSKLVKVTVANAPVYVGSKVDHKATKGATYAMLGEKEGWYKVVFKVQGKAKTGWLPKKFVRLVEKGATPGTGEGAKPPPAYAALVKTDTQVHVGNKKYPVKKGNALTVLGTTRDGKWCKVKFKAGTSDLVGYILSACVEKKVASAAKKRIVVVTAGTAGIFVDGKPLTKAKKDDRYEFVEKRQGYYKIKFSHGGKEYFGWIKADYVREEGGQ